MSFQLITMSCWLAFMITLLNRFTAIGSLSECKIDLYPTHMRCRFGVRINDYVVTMYYSMNKKFHEEQYAEFMSLIPYLRTESTGYVWVNGQKYHTVDKAEPTRLFISGNLTEKNERLFFNIEYMQLTGKSDDSLNISMRGVWTKYGFMNIVSDSPRIFNLNDAKSPSNQVYEMALTLNREYKIDGDVVKSFEKVDTLSKKSLEKCVNLSIKSQKKCDKQLEDKDIDNWILEWEIINDENC